MAAYYTYLVSSLPMLNFSAKAPFSLEYFFTKCRNLIPDEQIELLRLACSQDSWLMDLSATGNLKKWVNFETALRNELARSRSRRKKIDPLKFTRLPDDPDAHTSHVAMLAYRSASILEAEKILDKERWDFLDNLSFGHYFDFDFLLVYALKLKILERWDRIQKADKELLFNGAVLN